MSDISDIESVAIIGLSGRFPGAGNVDEFWENLCAGRESISFFSDEELLSNGADPALVGDDAYVRARGVLENVDSFDENFFGFTARDAEITDPQHRIFLECCWEAIEDAGYVAENIGGGVGIFAGSSLNTYLLHHVFSDPLSTQEFIRGFQAEGYPVLIGNDKDYLATRVAHKLNLRGPAITIQTACSTSLVAVVQACQSLLTYQCDAVLAGGVSITFPQQRGYIYQDGALASEDGHCRAFDEAGTGTVFGSGCGVVMLKRLSEAQQDGDHIYTVIKGAAVNNDGSDKVSFSAPSVNGQAEVIALAQALAGINADTINYIEAHGTGTPLGDPIEVSALTQAFRMTTDRKQFCGLGSVKTNVGHLEAAAGVTGLIKASLAIHHRRIPPSLHFEKSNPHIDFEDSPFYVISKLMDWPKSLHPRRAGVSSFGMGGTNAHVVLEEAPINNTRARIVVPQILPISARTATSLQVSSQHLGHFLQRPLSSEISLADIAYTLQVGRHSFVYRHAVVANKASEASEELTQFVIENNVRAKSSDEKRAVAFLFPGQGAQTVNMCQGLYENNAFFRKTVDNCCDRIVSTHGFDLRHILYPSPGDELKASEKLTSTAFAQPALFVIGYAVAKLIISWGIHPTMLAGHSIGEFVAAVIAEVMSLEDALLLVVSRGRLMQEMPAGSMLAVRLSESEILPYLSGDLSIAALNAPNNTVISGPIAKIKELQSALSGEGVGCKELQTSHAFHSEMMSEAAEKFQTEVEKVSLNPAKLKIVSTRTGQFIKATEWTAREYWWRQILEPVQFLKAGTSLLEDPTIIIVDIGPGQILANLIRQNPARKPDHLIVPSVPLLEKEGDYLSILRAIGEIWCSGLEVDWRAIQGEGPRFRVSLPTYPFDRKRHWVDQKFDKEKDRKSQISKRGLDDLKASFTDDVRSDKINIRNLENLILEQLQIMLSQLEAIKCSHGKNDN